MEKTYTFHINGMHCKSCVFLTEGELMDLPNITSAKSDLVTGTVVLTGNFGDQTEEVVAQELTEVLQKHGYSVSATRQESKIEKKWSEFGVAFVIALIFIVLFIALQKIGIVNMVNTGSVTYGTAFMVGVIASLSTCMAVVGGLLLSMSATFAKEGDRIKPQLLFHFGRIISFFVLGGVIGAIGAAFALSPLATFILGLAIGIVMLILGINLLDVFPWAKKLQPAMPRFMSKRVHGVSRLGHRFTPLLVGIVTFFLPCGFTQSMQLYTLSTGSFMKGGLTMLAFALGTLPVLALISFSSFSIKQSAKSGIFFKTAGLIVILFALFNILNSLVVTGVLPPLFNF